MQILLFMTLSALCVLWTKVRKQSVVGHVTTCGCLGLLAVSCSCATSFEHMFPDTVLFISYLLSLPDTAGSKAEAKKPKRQTGQKQKPGRKQQNAAAGTDGDEEDPDIQAQQASAEEQEPVVMQKGGEEVAQAPKKRRARASCKNKAATADATAAGTAAATDEADQPEASQEADGEADKEPKKKRARRPAKRKAGDANEQQQPDDEEELDGGKAGKRAKQRNS